MVLSMSGFVADVNEKAVRGARLNCIGLAPMHFMNILEGRITPNNVPLELRRVRGELFEHTPKPRIVASGRESWAGWVKLKTEPLADDASPTPRACSPK